MNLPTDKIGWREFYSEFAKLQSKLVMLSVGKLNVSVDEKEKILYGIIDKIKERLVD